MKTEFRLVLFPLLLAAFVSGICGCGDLAERGVNTVSLQYGVMYLDPPFSKTRQVSEIWLMNPDDDDHSGAKLELEIILTDGNVMKKIFTVGTVKPAEKWKKELDQPINNVSSIVFLYTCDQGAAKGSMDVENLDAETQTAKAQPNQRFGIPQNSKYSQDTPEECLRSIKLAIDNRAYAYMIAHLFNLGDDFEQGAFNLMSNA